MITPTQLGRAIICVATDYIGMVETKSNARWDDPLTAFKDEKKDAWLREWQDKIQGWDPGAPYCSAFTGAVVAFVLSEFGMVAELKNWQKFFTAHIMTNVRKCQKNGTLSQKPAEGGIWLAQHGKTDSGHGGFVMTFNTSGMTTIEANTSAGPTADPEQQRNGDGIWVRNFNQKGRGNLVTQGFLNPTGILNIVKA